MHRSHLGEGPSAISLPLGRRVKILHEGLKYKGWKEKNKQANKRKEKNEPSPQLNWVSAQHEAGLHTTHA